MAKIDQKALADKVAARMPLSIGEWCAVHHICRATFYVWRKAGLAPALTQPIPGGRATISADATKAWEARTRKQRLKPPIAPHRSAEAAT